MKSEPTLMSDQTLADEIVRLTAALERSHPAVTLNYRAALRRLAELRDECDRRTAEFPASTAKAWIDV